MSYRDELLEALMDKGYPRFEAYRYMRLMNCMPDIIMIPDPSIYKDSKSIGKYYRYWSNFYEYNSKNLLINVRYMKPVWNQFNNWDYEI